MGWGDYKTPALVDFENHGSSDLYDVRVYSGGTPSSDDDDGYEDNDKFEDAKSVTTNSYSGLKCNDEDWFDIYSNSGTLEILLSFTHSNGDLDLELYDSSKNRVAYSGGSSNSENINYEVNTSGYYYIKIFGYQGAKNNYSMSFVYTQPNPPSKATNQSPSNGATNRSITTDINWSDSGGATNYDIYFGTDPSPDSGEFKGNQTSTTYDLGTLNYSTTYYWRIDSKNSDGTTTGNVWYFITGSSSSNSPLTATNPSPSNGIKGQSVSTDISWSSGGGATSYDIYFGTDSTPDSGEFKGNQTSTIYDPGALNYYTTYYWRIDAKNSDGTTTGDVWYFITLTSDTDGDGLVLRPISSERFTDNLESAKMVLY